MGRRGEATQRILETFDRYPELTTSQIAERLGLTKGYIRYILDANNRVFKGSKKSKAMTSSNKPDMML